MKNYSINEAKKALKAGIVGYLAKDGNGTYRMQEVNRLPFYLEGSPGIGKTQMVSQVAEELGIGFVSFSITHHSRNTVLGLPVISELGETKYTEYTMSEIIAKVLEKYEAGEKEGILLLDEFNCMSDTLMPVMLAFLQTKNIGAHKLPEGWTIVLCGNPSAYNRNARTFDFAILDRMRRLCVEFNGEDFLQYAEEHHFEIEIQDFLKLNPSFIYMCTRDKEENLVTCRGWENLDIAMKMYREIHEEIDEKMIGQFIKSERVSREFYKYYCMRKECFTDEDCENIIEGKDLEHYVIKFRKMKFPQRNDAAEVLLKEILRMIREKKGSAEKIRDSINRVIKVFYQVGDKSCLEILLKRINEDKTFYEFLKRYETKEYLKLVKAAYFN